MKESMIFLQVIIGFGLLNVWIVRRNNETPYRGSNAKSLFEEFAAYGLPSWSFFVVGALKVSLAMLLLAGVWYRELVVPASLGIAVLMAGAVLMHAKVGDPIKKAIPAAVVLVFSSVVALV